MTEVNLAERRNGIGGSDIAIAASAMSANFCQIFNDAIGFTLTPKQRHRTAEM